MSSWAQHAIWWQIYPLGFVGADPRGVERRPERTLDEIAGWLDYAVDLGVSGLALGPIFQSSTHGYDTIDYFTIDERLGDRGSFDRLVEACRARGLRLLLDGVFNHVGPGFAPFQRVSGATASQADRELFVPAETQPKYSTFEGHPGLITLDHGQLAVADLIAGVMAYWLAAGADGWRLDAAYAVPRSFWSTMLARVRAEHPAAYFVGEVIHGDYVTIVQETGFDSLTQYELWKAI